MVTQKKLFGNKLIAEFDGWIYIPDGKYENDLYEAGDKAGGWETTDIYVKNPSEEFLKQKKFGSFADEDYYNDKKPYDNYKWSLNYNTDWNLLMGVVEKIENLFNGNMIIEIEGDNCRLSTNCNSVLDKNYFELYSTLNTKIESTYEAVIKFIKWYNNEKS
jgi:hypothetical protein